MNNTANRWFRPVSLLFGMVLAFDFFGHISDRWCENSLKEIKDRQQKFLEGLDRSDTEKIAEDWRNVGNYLRSAMNAVK
ncbi:MAG: hypothetical protein J6Y92_09935 [Lentisphaeria bacterium]|nr:hypothetical protein [Lentisphaeria bacterium]